MTPRETISCSGFCTRCGREHTLHAGPAHDACRELMRALESEGRIDLHVPAAEADPRFSTDVLFSESRGHMFGVMVYRDAFGVMGTAKAFSGQYNGVWQVEGWVGPVVDVARFDLLNTPGERAIKAVGRRMESLPSGTAERLELKRRRRAMSRELMEELFGLYRLTNFAGETRPLTGVFRGEGIPTGTGDCCAPKLLHHAVTNHLTPLGLAEFYWGRENRSGSKRHGRFYPACEEKCRPILGFLLCGLAC